MARKLIPDDRIIAAIPDYPEFATIAEIARRAGVGYSLMYSRLLGVNGDWLLVEDCRGRIAKVGARRLRDLGEVDF